MAGGILDALTEPRDAPSQVAKGVGNLLAFASFVATVFFCLMAYAAFNQGAWVLLILGGTLLFGLLSFAAKESRNSIPGYYSLRAARSIVYSLIVIVVVGSIFGVGKWGLDALVSTFGSTSARNSTGSDESSMASVQCERFVRERLKTPSTANFPFFADSSKKIDERRYVVQSHVDAENSFGAKLRNSYICVLEWNGQNHADINNWALVNFTIE